MTSADRIRALNSTQDGWTADRISDRTGIHRGYINRILKKGCDIAALNRKWSNRMRESLLRGEMVGSHRFYEFTKSGDYVDLGMHGGDGKTWRADSEWFLGLWRVYYGIYK